MKFVESFVVYRLKRLEVEKPDADAALKAVTEAKAHLAKKISANFNTHMANIVRFYVIFVVLTLKRLS